MRAGLLLVLWPGLASGQKATRCAWAIPKEGSGPSMLSLEPCDLPCVALARFDNTLVTTGQVVRPGPTGVVRTTLATAGLSVEVTVETGVGFAPDLMRVRAPQGYEAEPPEVLFDDGASGRVRVVLAPTSWGASAHVAVQRQTPSCLADLSLGVMAHDRVGFPGLSQLAACGL